MAGTPDVASDFFARNQTDPYPTFASMRVSCPVGEDPLTGAYWVAGYDSVYEVMKCPEKFSSRAHRLGALAAAALAGHDTDQLGEPRRLALVHDDDPYHAELRAVIARSFTPRAIGRREPLVLETARKLLDRIDPTQVVDFVESFAVPLPCRIIASMYGVPEDEYPLFKGWMDDFLSPDPSVHGPATANFYDYIDTFIQARRERPEDDMITHLVQARTKGGEPLPESEIRLLLLGNILAGNETTTNLLANTMRLLADRQDLWLQARADRSLVPKIVEESLRFESPVQWMPRTASSDVEISGVSIPKGATVVPLLGSANRDESKWAEPADFDPSAERQTRHLAFGIGTHFCVGAPLARLEATVSLNSMLERFESFELASEAERSAVFLGVRGFSTLPLRFFPGPSASG